MSVLDGALGAKIVAHLGRGEEGRVLLGGSTVADFLGGGQVELLLKSYHLMKTTSFFEQVCQPIELGP